MSTRKTVDNVELGEWVTCSRCSATVRSSYLTIHGEKVHRDEPFISQAARRRRTGNAYGAEIPKSSRQVAPDVTEVTSQDGPDEFARTFNSSNELIARKYVLKANPKKRNSPTDVERAKTAYLLSLEDFNICRNCNFAIKSREATFNGKAAHVADIPAHYEVVYCEVKRGLKFLFVERQTITDSKCKCRFATTRQTERNATPNPQERPKEMPLNPDATSRRRN